MQELFDDRIESDLRRPRDRRYKYPFDFQGSGLISLAGCKIQPLHRDFPSDIYSDDHFQTNERDLEKKILAKQKQLENVKKSFSIFIAFEDNSHILVLDENGILVKVTFQAGEALVGSGLLIHSGGTFCFYIIFINILHFVFLYIYFRSVLCRSREIALLC